MQYLKKILALNIFLFIILHSIIPHKHHNEMSCEENFNIHSNANDIIDYLSLIFHTTSGTNFETYFSKNSSHINKNPKTLEIKQTFLFTYLNNNLTILLWYIADTIHILISTENITPICLRAPPDYQLA